MENKVSVSINIEGTDITHFSTFKLVQRFNEHHSFELRVDYDQVETLGTISLDKSKDFIGRSITVEFGTAQSDGQIFIGKVTRVEFLHSNGYQGELIISGYSPSILLERGPDVGSYLNKNLQSIIQQATGDAPSNDLTLNIKPQNTAPIDYIIQYRESDFEFMNRLSAEYHEWFYYDGQNLNFGKPNQLKDVSLIYGRNLQTMQYAMQVAPLNYSKYAYDPQKDALLTSQATGATASTPDVSHAISSSNQVFSKIYNQPLPVRVNSKKEIDDFVNNEQKAIISELVRISGSGDEPQVALGSVLNISTSLRGQTSFEQQTFGKFLVTSVYHQVDDVGHYQNTFEGVTADTERLPVKEMVKPLADMQIATVLDNNDPEKQGRIKVQFRWQCAANDPTEWLRVVTPSAGNDDQGQNNRGFIAIPEVNDQVLVAFEEGNIARPVVMGSVYHSANGDSRQQVNNQLKSIGTRSGHVIGFDDSAASQGITITDRNNNVIKIDTTGNNITITAMENMTLTAKNININAHENLTSSAGKNVSTSAGDTLTEIAAKSHNTSAKDIITTADENSTHRSKKSETIAGKISTNSTDEDMELVSAKKVNIQSTEKVNLF
jgi:type VI secretion system secreted protein VgrG